MADWKNRKAPKTKKSRAKDRWVPGGQRLTGRDETPKPQPRLKPTPRPADPESAPPGSKERGTEARTDTEPPQSPTPPKTKKVSFDALLAARGITSPKKADLEDIAAEFDIDISKASNNDERAETLADYTYEV